MRKPLFLACILTLLLFPPALFAGEPETDSDPTEQFLSSFNYQKGLIELPNGVARLDVPEEFRYIGSEDAKRFLEDGWGNPDGSGTLGLLLPLDVDLFGPEGWAVVITYQEDGYVSDEDAADIDYDELLASMQESTAKANEKRQEMGYGSLSLVGWARQPHYDSEAKKLFWAKELKFDGEEGSTLNYNVRILGRKGVLVMNAVSAMSELPKIEERMDQVLAFSDFKEGHRYADYQPGVDKVAAYGIAALIGGKIAAKAGLFAKLGALLLAFKKVFIVVLVAIGGFFVKLFKRRKIVADPPPPAE